MRDTKGKRIRTKSRGGRRVAQHYANDQAGVSYFCTGPSCHKPTKTCQKTVRIEEAKMNSDLPYEYHHRERVCTNGHPSVYLYVINAKNARRFGVSGSY